VLKNILQNVSPEGSMLLIFFGTVARHKKYNILRRHERHNSPLGGIKNRYRL
jgi:hypothetical protein